MRLARIELEGFKSFAEHTSLEFGPGITGIVGPNGCGKSNIVDAVRWVLGELNPRTLRGKTMSDVIFHGNKHRRPATSAEVALTFADEARQLGTDSSEVRISRRLLRSGESEYSLNGKPCRLKDIRQMFMDTGVGVDTYSIMEQGKVDRLLQAGPKDRRYLFEEAAGISKFKSQRQETARRLERVQANVDQLAAVMGEVDERVRSVKRQAEKAQKHQHYEAELRELGLTLARARDHGYASQLGEIYSEVVDVEAAIAALASRRAVTNERATALDGKLGFTRDSLEAVRRELVRQREIKGASEDRIEAAAQRLRELESDEKRLRADQRRLEGLCATLEAELERLQADAAAHERARTGQHAALEAVREEEAKVKADALAIESELDRAKARALTALEARSKASNELAGIDAETRVAEGRKARIQARRAELAGRTEEQTRVLEARRADLAKASSLVASIASSLEAQKRELEATAGQLAQAAEKIAQVRDRRARATSRHELLAAQDAALEGVGDGARWLLGEAKAGRLKGIVGAVADLLDVPSELAVAVSSALGGLADAIAVADVGALKKIAATLAKRGMGGVVLVPLAELPPARKGAASGLAAKVGCAKGAERLRDHVLGAVAYADSLEAALGAIADGGCTVTREGHRVERGVVALAGGESSGGIIGRKAEIKALAAETAELEQRLAGLESTRAGLAQRHADLQAGWDELASSMRSRELSAVALEREAAEIARALAALAEEDQLLKGELDEIADVAVSLVERAEHFTLALERAIQTKLDLDKSIAELLARQQAARKAFDIVASRLASAKVLVAQTEEKAIAARALLESSQRERDERRHELASARTSELECADRRARVVEQREQDAVAALEAEESARGLDTKREALAGELARLDQAHRAAREELEVVAGQLDVAKERMSALAVSRRELEVARDNLHQRTADELGIDLAELALRAGAAAGGGAPDEPPAAPLSRLELRKLEKQYLRTKRLIKKLGPINAGAIEELAEHQTRADFLHAQHDDLVAGRDELAAIIAKLDAASTEQFLASFTAIRDNFRALFRKLFGGGRADLVLEDPTDLLETGIEIVACPPGKQPRTISLLSGGERAMTAISLLFSVYQTRPSPFCLLDEIDAPLDQANVERFTQLVREFLTESQFLIITHSKQTMSAADALFGVTSGNEPGVSRLVSVRLDSAEALAG